jgi:hypothetical protein
MFEKTQFKKTYLGQSCNKSADSLRAECDKMRVLTSSLNTGL